jgi:hypothetical protein
MSAPPSKRRNPRPTPAAPRARASAAPAAAGASTPRGSRLRLDAGTVALLCSALAFLFFLPAFLPDRQLFGTDYLGAGYFIREFIARRFADGVLPQWMPHLYGGLPVFANPGSTYHPLQLLLEAILPMPRVLPALLVVQFALGGLGMFLLSRALGARGWVALLSALAFEFTGLTISYVYAGHDGRIIGATSAPLLFFFLHRGISTGRALSFAGVAATVAGALLSFQIQSAYYLLLAGALWSLALLLTPELRAAPPVAMRRASMAVAAVALAFAISAVNFLPFSDYVASSPRGGGGRGYEFATSYSMPPAELLAVAVPEQAGALDDYRGSSRFKLHTEYVGALVIALLALGAVFARGDRHWRFFAVLAALGVLLALGGNTPIYRLFYAALPGTRLFRAPSIAFMLVPFSLAAMAALSLERLAALRDAAADARRASASTLARQGVQARAALVLAGVLVLVLAGAATAAAEGDGDASASLGWMRFAVTFAVIGATLWSWFARRLATRAAAIALAALTVADLWIVGNRFRQTELLPDQLYAADDVVDFLRKENRGDRVWVFPFPEGAGPRYSGNDRFGVNSNYLMRFGIEQVGGEHGNQLQRWNDVLGAAQGALFVDWHNFVGAPWLLNALNVGWVIAAVELDFRENADTSVVKSGLRKAFTGRGAAVFRNDLVLPRAYLVPQVGSVTPGEALALMTRPGWDPAKLAFIEAPDRVELPEEPLEGHATVVSHEPDRVVVRTNANRPAFLVLADNWYAGWRATVNGTAVRVHRANHTLRGVMVPAGTQEVVFTFRADDLHLGVRISLVAVAALVAWALLAWRRERGAPRNAASAPVSATPA